MPGFCLAGDMTLVDRIERACLLEAAARKPGNVHPGAAFDDLRYEHFVTAARVSAPLLASAPQRGLGRSVLDAVRATREATGTNVNLGMCLLLAPLACGAATSDVWDGARAALANSTVEDSRQIYEAIRAAQPGGLGQATTQDVSQTPTLTIPEVMALAAHRDDIARELATGFVRLQQEIVPFLHRHWSGAVPASPPHSESGGSHATTAWDRGIVLTHLRLIADGDTLIRRKCGPDICQEAALRARQLLEFFFRTGELDPAALANLDHWLRADGHRRNPGTSADLIAAALFVILGSQAHAEPTMPSVYHQPHGDTP
jgi:triphosphoribosyl-dephospho-CoA synthase